MPICYSFLIITIVRPTNLIHWWHKLYEIQIASLLDLTIDKLHNSLGLTLLHASMCSANTEVSKWLITNYPEMLSYKDSQRDTPLMISLKECSYYLIMYSQQNNGKLDDNTSYSDNDFMIYYPEINNFREKIRKYGKLISSVRVVLIYKIICLFDCW